MDLEKVFKWKKANFTTDLPKASPRVSYLVGKGISSDEVYMMHVVTLAQNYRPELYRNSKLLLKLKSDKKSLVEGDDKYRRDWIILCHIRRADY